MCKLLCMRCYSSVNITVHLYRLKDFKRMLSWARLSSRAISSSLRHHLWSSRRQVEWKSKESRIALLTRCTVAAVVIVQPRRSLLQTWLYLPRSPIWIRKLSTRSNVARSCDASTRSRVIMCKYLVRILEFKLFILWPKINEAESLDLNFY